MNRSKFTKKELADDIEFIISECWELTNKPRRFFQTLIEIIAKYDENCLDTGTQNRESLHALLAFVDNGIGFYDKIEDALEKDVFPDYFIEKIKQIQSLNP